MIRSLWPKVVAVTFAVLRVRSINLLIRNLLKPFLPLLPAGVAAKFPISGTIKLELTGGRSFLFKSDGRDQIASRLYWAGFNGHEPETILIYRHLLKRSRVIIDVGASTGLFTLIAGAECADGEIHAFEPVPETFEYMVKNIAANQFGNVKSVCACVLDSDGETTLYLNRSPALPMTASTLKDYRTADRTILAESIKLDTYVAKNGLSAVDLIKIDAEGSDPQVLEGALEVMKAHKPVIICEVLYNHTDVQLQKILDGAEYRYFSIRTEGLEPVDTILGDSDYKYRNYLFVPNSKVPEILEGMSVVQR